MKHTIEINNMDPPSRTYPETETPRNSQHNKGPRTTSQREIKLNSAGWAYLVANVKRNIAIP